VSMQTVASDSAASATGHGGTCIVKTRVVTSAPAAPDAHSQTLVESGRDLVAHGGRAG
jgi:hypothetical protein